MEERRKEEEERGKKRSLRGESVLVIFFFFFSWDVWKLIEGSIESAQRFILLSLLSCRERKVKREAKRRGKKRGGGGTRVEVLLHFAQFLFSQSLSSIAATASAFFFLQKEVSCSFSSPSLIFSFFSTAGRALRAREMRLAHRYRRENEREGRWESAHGVSRTKKRDATC